MNRKFFILPIAIIALISLACSININLPDIQNKTGPTVTDDISVPLLKDSTVVADVNLNFGVGNLTLKSGATSELISGTAKYNVTDLKPTVMIDNDNITIEQGNLKLNGIPIINSNIINDWDLSLGNSPMSLYIKAGAYTGNYELGGLSIHRLEITDGAAKVQLNFSKPNQVEMTALKYMTGASEVSLRGLGNANADEITFNGGAGNYTLDFSGELSRDVTVSIDAGVSSVTVIVPTGVPAELSTNSTLITVSSSGGWEHIGNTYQLSGSGYKITIQARMGAGTLQLQTNNSGK
ncbi:MAG: toast rack family protein [Anaerolineales bacterium]